MVGRIWRGWTKSENADKYEALLKAEIFPEIASKDVPGYRGIQLLREPADEGKSEVEFVTIMWFDSWESVRRFAGDDYERAYVPPRAFDERSRHYEVRERLEY
jgi:heme-degrading monooxygenase HmoA